MASEISTREGGLIQGSRRQPLFNTQAVGIPWHTLKGFSCARQPRHRPHQQPGRLSTRHQQQTWTVQSFHLLCCSSAFLNKCCRVSHRGASQKPSPKDHYAHYMRRADLRPLLDLAHILSRIMKFMRGSSDASLRPFSSALNSYSLHDLMWCTTETIEPGHRLTLSAWRIAITTRDRPTLVAKCICKVEGKAS